MVLGKGVIVLLPRKLMCIVTAQGRILEEAITLNLQDLKFKKNSFSRSGTCVWNNLALQLSHVNKRRFKKELRVSLLNILESENEYIGVSELITRLPTVKFTV